LGSHWQIQVSSLLEVANAFGPHVVKIVEHGMQDPQRAGFGIGEA
jgi:hypothetical protein